MREGKPRTGEPSQWARQDGGQWAMVTGGDRACYTHIAPMAPKISTGNPAETVLILKMRKQAQRSGKTQGHIKNLVI